MMYFWVLQRHSKWTEGSKPHSVSLRNHGIHAVYNARFELIKDNDSKEFRSLGHFWFAVEKPQTSESRGPSVSQGNEWRSVLALS